MIAIAILTAALIAGGQILFKAGADKLEHSQGQGFILGVITSPTIIFACAIYALSIFLWIWVLKHAPLSKAYPFTALAYVLTPLLGAYFFKEQLSQSYIVGLLLLLAGLFVISLGDSG